MTSAVPSSVESGLPAPSKLPFLQDLSKALKTLPSCQRCKKGRRRCDTLLPSCDRCRRARQECLFYDHALKQVLPRSYVQTLLKNAQELQRQLGQTNQGQVAAQGEKEDLFIPSDDPTNASNVTSFDLITSSQSVLKRVGYPVGYHFPVTTPQGPTVRFFGFNSVFSLGLSVVTNVRADPTFTLPAIEEPQSPDMEPPDFHGTCNCTITKTMVERSLQLYINSVHALYPFLDATSFYSDLEAYWDVQSSGIDVSNLEGQQAHQFFRIKIIAAIASASRSRQNASRIACDHGCFVEAVKCIAEVTSEVSTDSLRALMLLIIYCLFRPRKGDVWRLLNYACRLCLDLGYHTEPGPEISTLDQNQRRDIFRSLYAIEKTVSQLFDRPSELPESLVTSEMHISQPLGDIEIDAGASSSSQTLLDQYRLISIRSRFLEQQNKLDGVIIQNSSWYLDSLSLLESWYLSAKEATFVSKVSEATSMLGFHATILGLFQPLVVRCLHLVRDPAFRNEAESTFIPMEIFLSSGRLVEILEQIWRSPRDSDLGIYPFTIIPAYYTYLASMMIVAYCLFNLDGRIPIRKTITLPNYMEETSRIEISNLLPISNSCLILLTSCAEKWPGLVAMRDIYKQLSDQVLSHFLRETYASVSTI